MLITSLNYVFGPQKLYEFKLSTSMKRFKIELVFQVLDFLKFPKVVLFPCCWRVILGVLDRRTGSDALRLLCVTHSVCCVSPADPASDNANAMRPIVRLGTFVSHL